MIAKTGAASEELIDLPGEAIERVKKQSQSLSHGDIFYIINVISNSLKMIKQLLPERIVLELCMIKLTTRDSIISIEELISKLPEVAKSSHSQYQAASISTAHAARSEENVSQTIARKIQQSINQVKKTNSPEKTPSHDAKPLVDMTTRVKDAWPILVKAMAVKKMSISSYLAESEPDSVKGSTIFVAFPRELNFHREVLEEPHNKSSIEAALSQILDATVKLQFIATDKKLKEPEKNISPLTREELKNKEPVIDATLNIFGGKILKAKGT